MQSTVLTIAISQGGPPPPPPTLPSFYNLRGPTYPWEPLKVGADQRGSPDPEWSFPQFRSLGWNLVRMDWLSWGKYTQDKTTWLSNLARFYNAANANGVWVIWEIPGVSWEEMPADVQAGISLTNFNAQWWNDFPYPGTDPTLVGLGIWEAIIKGFVNPIIQIIDPQPCTLGYKFYNEPSGIDNGTLARYYGTFGNNLRSVAKKRFVYEGGAAAAAGSVGLISDILLQCPTYKPAIYDYHYNNPIEGSQAASLGVDYWDGENFPYSYTSSTLPLYVAANCASNFYRWDKDGDLLVADGTGSGDGGTLTSTSTNLAALCTQILGPAKFFV